jgi:hypothetical protein
VLLVTFTLDDEKARGAADACVCERSPDGGEAVCRGIRQLINPHAA